MKTTAIEQCIAWMDDWQTASDEDRAVAAEARAELEALRAQLAATKEALKDMTSLMKGEVFTPIEGTGHYEEV